MQFATLALALASSVSAHFLLNYPAARGFDDDKLTQYPCGGQNTPSSNRTLVPVNGAFPIQLDMHHSQAKVEVLIALGNAPTGADFTTVVVPTFQEIGPGSFCLGDVRIPANISGRYIASGMNATILVQTNGDSSSEPGLYNCADVTFSARQLDDATYSQNCMNSTGVTTKAIAQGATTNANGSTVGTDGSVSTSTSSGLAVPMATAAGYAVGFGAGAIGMMALL